MNWIAIRNGIAIMMMAAAGTVGAAGLLLAIAGFDVQTSLVRLLSTSFSSRYLLAQTAEQAVPILLCAIGIAFAARLGRWNIGAEGQFYVGAVASVGLFQYFPDLPRELMLSLMFFFSMTAGALWILGPALLRAYLGVSEILTTLMMNYVSFPLLNYLLYGPWRSPSGFNFPVTNRFSENAVLPVLPGFPVHVGFVFALFLAVLVHFVLWQTTIGFRVRATGNNREAANYVGYRTRAIDISVLCISGALAGLAGMIQVTGVTHQLLPNISPGFGYLGIMVASLALISIAGCVPIALLLAVILVGSKGMEATGVPGGIANFISGLLLLLSLIGVALASSGPTLHWQSIKTRRAK
jgi:general nucleoside transport system permease protein